MTGGSRFPTKGMGAASGTSMSSIELWSNAPKTFDNNTINNTVDSIHNYVSTMYPTSDMPGTQRSTDMLADYPELYKKLGEIVIGYINAEMGDILRYVLHPETSYTQTYATDVVFYLPDLPEPEAPMGTSRLLEHMRFSRETQQTRFGLMVQVNQETLKTPMGRETFNNQMRQLANSFNLLAEHVAFGALARCDSDFHPLLAYTELNHKQYEEKILEICNNVGLFHKRRRGAALAMNRVNERMSLKTGGITPDFCFLDNPDSSVFLDNSLNISYYEAGPDGPPRLYGQKRIPVLGDKLKLLRIPTVPESRARHSQISKTFKHGRYNWCERYDNMPESPVFEPYCGDKDRLVRVPTEKILSHVWGMEQLDINNKEHQFSLQTMVVLAFFDWARAYGYFGDDADDYAAQKYTQIIQQMNSDKATFQSMIVTTYAEFEDWLKDVPGKAHDVFVATTSTKNPTNLAAASARSKFKGVDSSSQIETECKRVYKRYMKEDAPPKYFEKTYMSSRFLFMNYLINHVGEACLRIFDSDYSQVATYNLGFDGGIQPFIDIFLATPLSSQENVYVMNALKVYSMWWDGSSYDMAGRKMLRDGEETWWTDPIQINNATDFHSIKFTNMLYTPSSYLKGTEDSGKQGFLLVRPYPRNVFKRLIFCKGGPDLGVMATSPLNLMQAEQTSDMTFTAHASAWMGGHIKNPRLVDSEDVLIYDTLDGGTNLAFFRDYDHHTDFANNEGYICKSMQDASTVVIPTRVSTTNPGKFLDLPGRPRCPGCEHFPEQYDFAASHNRINYWDKAEWEYFDQDTDRDQISKTLWLGEMEWDRIDGGRGRIESQMGHGPCGEQNGSREVQEWGRLMYKKPID